MDKKIISFAFGLILFFLAIFIIFHFVVKFKKETDDYQTKIMDLQNQVDSLYAENYPCQIELNRFQVAFKIFARRNPRAASEYGDIISNETE